MAKLKDWDKLYNEENLAVADTLQEAKQDGKQYYRHECGIHGKTVYATLDNTCPHCVREKANNRRIHNLDFNRPRELVLQRKRRAKQRGIKFEITTEDIRGNIPTHCPVFGSLLKFNEGDNSPSLDRLNCDEGYTKNNTKIISTRANRVKSDGTAEEHMKIAIWMLRENGFMDNQIIDIFNTEFEDD